MADNTVTFVMDGNVPLEQFAKGVSAFNELVKSLTKEVAGQPVRWILDDLQYSSAIASARAEGDLNDINIVVNAYAEVGRALESNEPLRYGKRVATAANKIVNIGVERVRFETAEREAIVPTRIGSADVISIREDSPTLQILHGRKPAFGGVKGRIQTLTSRGGLRFTLFDTYQDKAVSCYFAEGKEDLVKDLWGKLAIVEGVVTRDPANGRPLAIRGVKDITQLPEPSTPKAYQSALGVAPSLNGLSAEDAIRRIRDAI